VPTFSPAARPRPPENAAPPRPALFENVSAGSAVPNTLLWPESGVTVTDLGVIANVTVVADRTSE
jgi:hypothetical protein